MKCVFGSVDHFKFASFSNSVNDSMIDGYLVVRWVNSGTNNICDACVCIMEIMGRVDVFDTMMEEMTPWTMCECVSDVEEVVLFYVCIITMERRHESSILSIWIRYGWVHICAKKCAKVGHLFCTYWWIYCAHSLTWSLKRREYVRQKRRKMFILNVQEKMLKMCWMRFEVSVQLSLNFRR